MVHVLYSVRDCLDADLGSQLLPLPTDAGGHFASEVGEAGIVMADSKRHGP